MMFNKSTVLSLMAVSLLQEGTFVDAKSRLLKARKTSKSKSSKTEITVKCSKHDSKSSKQAKYAGRRAKRIRQEYDVYENTSIATRGLFQTLNPIPGVEVGGLVFYSDDYCPEDIERYCLEQCNEDPEDIYPGCTAVSININKVRDETSFFRHVCNYSKYLVNYPAAAVPLPRPLPVNETFTGFSLKSVPSLLPFEPSVLVDPLPPDNTMEPPFPGRAPSADWTTYILPTVQCVATQGFTAAPDETLPLLCIGCINKAIRDFQMLDGNKNCGSIANFICTDGALFGGEDSKCSDVCFDCDALTRTGALANIGQDITYVLNSPTEEVEFGCYVRPIYDPQSREFLEDFTCPPAGMA